MAPVARSGVLSVDDQDEVGGAHAQESLENYQRTLEVDLSRRTESYEMREQEYQEAIAELEDELDASRRGEHRAPAWGLAEFDEEHDHWFGTLAEMQRARPRWRLRRAQRASHRRDSPRIR